MYAIENRKSLSQTLEQVFRYLDSFNETIFETLFRSKQNDPGNLGAYIRSKREEANVSFYERVWTLEELKEELRILAKDMEVAQLYDPPKEEYNFRSSYGQPTARELLERKRI
jgi:protoheme ferro-lyase